MLKDVSNLDYFDLTSNKIILGEDFKKIPSSIFSKVLNYIIHFSLHRLEILFYIYYDCNKNYIITIPKQRVSEYKIIVCQRDLAEYCEMDIQTKRIIETNRLCRLGSIHSHHVMSTRFSLDDDLSDFSAPPGLHILLGDFPSIQILSSVAVMSNRYYLKTKDVINYTDKHYYEEITNKDIYPKLIQEI